MARFIVGVMGGSVCSPSQARAAEVVGRAVAQAGAVLLCGAGTGVMEAAAKGAHDAGGLVLGILPGSDKARANAYVDIPVVTAMGDARNAINVLTADLVVAIGGAAGTLSEIVLALKRNKPVLGYDTCRPVYAGGAEPQGFKTFAEIEDLLAELTRRIDG